MELTYHTDYALRTLIYAALNDDRLCHISEIASSYRISRNHLMKVVHRLAIGGFLRTYRGKHGGLTLARPAAEINLGDVVRYTEGPFRPVECFRVGNDCAISGACNLPSILNEANAAFVAALDRYTLADLLVKRGALVEQLVSKRRA